MTYREEEGHLHARRVTTSEDELGVTQTPMARSAALPSTSKPGALPLPRTRRASITPSDAKLYAMAQARLTVSSPIPCVLSEPPHASDIL